jgi:hypothetical protein
MILHACSKDTGADLDGARERSVAAHCPSPLRSGMSETGKARGLPSCPAGVKQGTDPMKQLNA